MLFHLILVPFALIGIILYWRARQANDLGKVRFIQPGLTLLLIAIALLGQTAPGARWDYTLWIVAGLGLALIGDINNVDMQDDRTVLIGIGLFVAAYLTYAVGLTWIGGFHAQDFPVGLALCVSYAVAVAYLWPGLGSMRLPVLIYATVLPALLWRAIGTTFAPEFSKIQSGLLIAGAALLYVGDLEFGIHRFRRKLPLYLGPACYGGGQLLIALSPAYFKLCPEWLTRTC